MKNIWLENSICKEKVKEIHAQIIGYLIEIIDKKSMDLVWQGLPAIVSTIFRIARI